MIVCANHVTSGCARTGASLATVINGKVLNFETRTLVRYRCVWWEDESSPAMYHDGVYRSIDFARCCAWKRWMQREVCKKGPPRSPHYANNSNALFHCVGNYVLPYDQRRLDESRTIAVYGIDDEPAATSKA